MLIRQGKLPSSRESGAGPSLTTHHLGPHPLIRYYLEQMNFQGIVHGCLGRGTQQGLDHGQVLSVLVHNILVSRGSMYRVGPWAGRIAPSALGLTASQVGRLNDDRIVRSLEALASERGRSVFFRLALRVIKAFEIQNDRVHFDTTSVTLFGQYEGSRGEPRIARGINKDHRPDLKQLLFGLNVSSDGSVPLLHHVFSGNRSDDTVHIRNVDELRALLGRDDFIYVADSKLCTASNLKHVADYGGHFVTIMPRTHKEDQVFRKTLRQSQPPIRWRKIHEIPNHRRKGDPPDVYASTQAGPDKSADGYRIIWIRSSQKAELDRQARMGRIRQAEIELTIEVAKKLGRRHLKTKKQIQAKVQRILENFKVTDFIEVNVATFTAVEHAYLAKGRPRPNSPMRKIRTQHFKLVVNRAKTALRNATKTDGVFPLITNMEKNSKKEILEIYKYQPYLEKRFAYTKTEYGIAPIFLKKPIRVIGLIHTYFVAIMLAALLERQVRSAMKIEKVKKLPILPEGRRTATPTTPRILENFENVTAHSYQEGERLVNFPIKLDQIQKQLLNLADVPAHHYR